MLIWLQTKEYMYLPVRLSESTDCTHMYIKAKRLKTTANRVNDE